MPNPADQATRLHQAKSMIQEVMENYPEAACGSAWLERAAELIGCSEDELDRVAEEAA